MLDFYVPRNRLPMISDGLSHWSDIFLWRHHHYEAIVSAYDAQHDQVFDTIERHRVNFG